MNAFTVNLVAVTLFGGTCWGSPARPVPVADALNLPPIGEAQPLALTTEERRSEAVAAERIHNAVIEAGIEATHHQGKTRLESLLRLLLTEGSASEKALYALSTDRPFVYPRRLQTSRGPASFRPAFDRGVECRATRCIKWGTEQVCNNRSICKIVCTAAAGGVGGAIGGGVGGAVGVGGATACNEVCQTIPECRTVDVCHKYEWSGAGCF